MINYNKFLKTLLYSAALVLAINFFAVYLPAAFRGEFVPNPIIFSVGNVDLRWYGLLISLGVLLSYFISKKEFSADESKQDKFDDIFLIVLIAGIIGARLGFVIQDTKYFFSSPIEILKIFDGGLSIHGALILGLIGLWFSSKKFKLNFQDIANAIAPQVMIAGAIGRFGNFFNQEIIGKPLDKYFFKMSVAVKNRPLGFEKSAFFHPVFIYESLLLATAYFIYILLKKKLKKYALIYTLIAYSIIRIIVEPFRIDYKHEFMFLDLAQIISLGIIVFAIIYLFILKKSKRNR